MNRLLWLSLTLISCVTTAQTASLESFTKGPLLDNYGGNAVVAGATIPANTVFKVAFDVGKQADTGTVNRKFNSLARFLNMHVRAGVTPDNIQLALVVHGKAAFDLLHNTSYQDKFTAKNANQDLLETLFKHNVRVMLCGQTAAAYGITKDQLIKGVELPLSAMTAHALLQQSGYTVNPF